MRRLLSVFLIAGVALGACASPRKADVRLPQGFEAPQPTGAETVALESWWTAFNDPELTTLIDQALAANPDVRRAAAVLKEARAVRTSIFLQMLPQGDAAGSYRKTHTDLLSGANATIPGFSTSGTSEA